MEEGGELILLREKDEDNETQQGTQNINYTYMNGHFVTNASVHISDCLFFYSLALLPVCKSAGALRVRLCEL